MIIVFVLVMFVFGFYVGNFFNYDKIYGFFVGIIIFLFWLWIVNFVLFFGVEFDVEFECGC